ncbi:hypothetical protein SAMN06265348_106165 [Pedobacter westerhofensis]|uniref:Uncharacterized protein n=1 Tax=Pedobacter westerhofensis TaxID=425512 RepID=A0A521DU35_9SPHI|nr:hypothetical protein SAMN06265348_106165 [Pedobacter westerhofensis]
MFQIFLYLYNTFIHLEKIRIKKTVAVLMGQ